MSTVAGPEVVKAVCVSVGTWSAETREQERVHLVGRFFAICLWVGPEE